MLGSESPFGIEREGGVITYDGNDSQNDILEGMSLWKPVQWEEADYTEAFL